MRGQEDRRDRNEAIRLLAAALGALALLLVLIAGGVYFIADIAHDPFSAGLGLKNAALISFGVSLALILVMAIVSGGDAIFGELPFTIAGFLLFFVVFWLMIAWIF
jgi:hypothetical protein